jgi:hypothetical protein
VKQEYLIPRWNILTRDISQFPDITGASHDGKLDVGYSMCSHSSICTAILCWPLKPQIFILGDAPRRAGDGPVRAAAAAADGAHKEIIPLAANIHRQEEYEAMGRRSGTS